jgi:hypothetical protein
LFLEHFNNWSFLDFILIKKLLEHRRFENSEANPQTTPINVIESAKGTRQPEVAN